MAKRIITIPCHSGMDPVAFRKIRPYGAGEKLVGFHGSPVRAVPQQD